jgi:hypothetical protein
MKENSLASVVFEKKIILHMPGILKLHGHESYQGVCSIYKQLV